MGFWGKTKTWLFGGDDSKGMPTEPQSAPLQRDYLQGMLGRPAPMMDQSQQAQFRGQQSELANRLNLISSGNAPGAGELTVNRQVGQAQAAQAAQAATARGANSALANRTAARNVADIGVSGAGQAAIAQQQDRAMANNQLGQLLGTARGQDIGVAQGNQAAQMDQQKIQLQSLAQMLGVDALTLQQDLAKRGIDINDKGMFANLLAAVGTVAGAYFGGGAGAAAGGTAGKAIGGG